MLVGNPSTYRSIEVLGVCKEVYGEEERLMHRFPQMFRVEDFVNDTCRICRFGVVRMLLEVFELDRIGNLKDDGIIGL